MRKSVIILILSLAVGACGPTGTSNSGGAGGASGGAGGHNTGGSSGSGTGGSGGIDPGGMGCATGAQYIYLVDENKHFFRYNPAAPAGSHYMDLGVLNCPSSGTCGGITPATPFSMGVDRNAIAWVLYCDGSLYRVDINANIACTATNFSRNQNGFEVFGMGFSTDVSGMAAETLFISGGAYTQIDMGAAQFGHLAMPALAVSRIGSVASGWPELTGTGDAELWGFFPSDTGVPRVAKLNKQTGTDIRTYNVNQIVGMPRAWAFAFWGDGFYIFLMRATDTQTTVYHVRRSDGMADSMPFDTSGPHTIVGAGVSTCAPIVGIQEP